MRFSVPTVLGEGLAGEDDGLGRGSLRGLVVGGCVVYAVERGLWGEAARNAGFAIVAATTVASATVAVVAVTASTVAAVASIVAVASVCIF